MKRLVLGCLLVLSGCGGNVDSGVLEARLDELRTNPTGQVAPLPDAPRYRPATYAHGAGRDPFVAPGADAPVTSGLAPDAERPRQPLERFPLASLTLLGTLEVDRRPSALVRDPAGSVHRLYVGAYLGTDSGRIVAIHRASLELMETVPDGRGGWTRRHRTLALSDGHEQPNQG